MSMPLRVRHLLSSKTLLLSEFIISQLEISAEIFLAWLDLGAIYLNQKRCLADLVLDPGDYIRVHVQPKRFAELKHSAENYVLAWEKDFVIFNKPQGYPCHPTVDNRKENLITYFENHFQRKFYLTHRLDNGTGGVWLLALNSEFQKTFNLILQNQQSQKIYWARTEKKWTQGSGLFTHHMKPSLRAPREVFEQAFETSLECRLQIENIIDTENLTSDLEIRLLTGRTHQIRSQLAFLGNPILGDLMYGSSDNFNLDLRERWALWAKELIFEADQKYHFKLPEEFLHQALIEFSSSRK